MDLTLVCVGELQGYILDEIKFVLESHKEVCAVFLPSLSGGGGMAGGGGGMDSGGGGIIGYQN